MSAPVRHFLDLDELDSGTLRSILDQASELKALGPRDRQPRLPGKTLAMIFDKPSTRTRVSFEVAIKVLGGDAVVLNSKDMQLGRGETIADTGRVLSRYVDAIMIRTDVHSKLLELAQAATVPVINGLTDHSHPCQIMADVMTFEEHRGPIRDRTLAWVGDGNNVARWCTPRSASTSSCTWLARRSWRPPRKCWPGPRNGRRGCSCSRIRARRSRAPMRC